MARPLPTTRNRPRHQIAYGALASARLGEWPAYSAAQLRAALGKAHGWRRGAVLKPATDGGNVGTILLSGFGALENGSLQYRVDRHDGQRWRRLRWSTEAALSHAAQHLGASAPAGRWAQSYMHRGMLLQARYDCARGECKPGELRRQHGLSCGGRGTGCILEVKAHVVFGRLSCIIVEQVPVAFNVSLYATVSDTGVVDCAESDGAIAEARGAENGAHVLPPPLGSRA